MISSKNFIKLSGIVFFGVGFMHLVRLFSGFSIVIAGVVIPQWISLLGVIIAWFLAYSAYNLSKKNKR
ncbi:MAG TPA: hypothetical protein VF189_06405 [Patescibacteria group bacterium]